MALVLFAGFLMTHSESVLADNFRLRNGGQVSGRKESRTEKGDYVILTHHGSRITLSKKQIVHIDSEDSRHQEYRRKSRMIQDTPSGHHEMAAWCKQQGLKSEAKHHLQRVLELDPHDESARRSMGYQRIGNQWMTREQLMAKRGLFFYKGKYRTAQDIALRKQAEARDVRIAYWQTNIKRWMRWLSNRQSSKATEAHEQLTQIRDPLATPALIKFLDAEEDPRIRSLFISILAQINSPSAIGKLVDLSLMEPDPDMRLQCLEYLMKSKYPISLSPYIHALSHPNNVIVNRAGIALQEIGDPAAISPLIDALVTTHKFKLSEGSPGQMNASATTSSAGGGAGGFSFGGNGPKIETRVIENFDIQRALVYLSGDQNFGFDQGAWRHWLINQRMQAQNGARRDD